MPVEAAKILAKSSDSLVAQQVLTTKAGIQYQPTSDYERQASSTRTM